nr:FRG domain-containing protein [uncultured Undibacterium sp.]
MIFNYSTQVIENINELVSTFIELRGWVFRGHKSDKYILESSLERYCNFCEYSSYAQSIEDTMISDFKSRAHLYLSRDIIPDTKLGWLSLMQHHGCPTRLIDFTTLPYVALFFAQDGFDSSAGSDMCIWAISNKFLETESFNYLSEKAGLNVNYKTFALNKDRFFDEIFDRGGHPIIISIEPKITNLRLESQSGLFLLSGSYDKKFNNYFVPTEEKSTHARKIVISSRIVNDVIRLLMDTGINNRRIYPGIDGVGKDIAAQLKIQLQDELKNLVVERVLY